MEEFFMQKNTNLEEEIIFFDAELADDGDDEDIPMGTLISAPTSNDEPQEEVATDVAPEAPATEVEPAPKKKAKKAEKPAPAVDETAVETKEKPRVANTTTAPKKQTSEADIWGLAVIKTNKSKEEKPADEPKVEEKKPAPKKKAPAKVETAEPQEVKKPAPKKAKVEKVDAPEETTAPKAEPKAKTNTTKNTTKKTSEEEPKVAKEVKAPEEQIIQEGTREYHGKFVIKKTDKGHFVYKLFAYGNKVVAIGAQAYEGLSGVKGGIASVTKIAGIDTIIDLTKAPEGKLPCPRWEIFEDKKEEFRLRLIASNGNLVATTNDGYTTKAAAKKGIESVAKAADGAAIVRNDNAW